MIQHPNSPVETAVEANVGCSLCYEEVACRELWIPLLGEDPVELDKALSRLGRGEENVHVGTADLGHKLDGDGVSSSRRETSRFDMEVQRTF